MKSKELAPIQATTFNKVCSLNADHYSTDDFWLLNDGHNVNITEQRTGEKHKQSISIPISDFNRLVRWYIRPQKLKTKKP